jgi:hypothetical protein
MHMAQGDAKWYSVQQVFCDGEPDDCAKRACVFHGLLTRCSVLIQEVKELGCGELRILRWTEMETIVHERISDTQERPLVCECNNMHAARLSYIDVSNKIVRQPETESDRYGLSCTRSRDE